MYEGAGQLRAEKDTDRNLPRRCIADHNIKIAQAPGSKTPMHINQVVCSIVVMVSLC